VLSIFRFPSVRFGFHLFLPVAVIIGPLIRTYYNLSITACLVHVVVVEGPMSERKVKVLLIRTDWKLWLFIKWKMRNPRASATPHWLVLSWEGIRFLNTSFTSACDLMQFFSLSSSHLVVLVLVGSIQFPFH
jgi:hypothetical protein